MLAIAGISPGTPFTATTVQEVTARLRGSKKFEDVQVLKRFASIEDPTQIALVIIVNEGPVKLERSGEGLTVVRRRGLGNLMFLPILFAEDGYGLTYGVRFAFVNKAGAQSRVSFPLTWGGSKRAAVELERRFASGPFTRIQSAVGVEQRTNPAYLEDDTRKRVWGRVERAMGRVRAGDRRVGRTSRSAAGLTTCGQSAPTSRSTHASTHSCLEMPSMRLPASIELASIRAGPSTC